MPWLQALGLLAIVVVVLADLLVPDTPVPWIVYGAIPALVFGIGPETFMSVFKGR